jgi:hypothetical protein
VVKGAVETEPAKEQVKEHTKEETTSKEMKGEIVMEEFAKQPPTEEGGLFCKLRELKKKILGHLLCMS